MGHPLPAQLAQNLDLAPGHPGGARAIEEQQRDQALDPVLESMRSCHRGYLKPKYLPGATEVLGCLEDRPDLIGFHSAETRAGCRSV